MKTAKEFIESDYSNLKLDCPNHVNDIADAMADFAKEAVTSALQEAGEQIEDIKICTYEVSEYNDGLHEAKSIVLSLIPKDPNKEIIGFPDNNHKTEKDLREKGECKHYDSVINWAGQIECKDCKKVF